MTINDLIFGFRRLGKEKNGYRDVQQERLDEPTCLSIVPGIFSLKLGYHKSAIVPLLSESVYRQVIGLSTNCSLTRWKIISAGVVTSSPSSRSSSAIRYLLLSSR